ncbi:Extracellular solute-binding protein, family 7 [Desulfurispirillum indicum S5]|uniref:Extracellular solute-binding protein, family 7 n=1 Tax=Desulfurispirillum indicum (strain ATCC BAA-1389 / DSM 22839 / S5) TaxID=653733 RepID=E6W2F3_DESIS|nr:TRAP transporter substrate-binding protein [Desulfurispirillum indicum]ADU66703.1 Extracellular solute-binding protein, family 7 [Desulfurispirillum indicum S5]
MRKILLILFALLFFPFLAIGSEDPTASWQPKFDPSGAKYTYILSNVSHPAIEGVAVGYRIRDRVWERTNGQLYVDFRPLAQLGGERDVLSKLRMGAVHGMLCSSVAAANLNDRLGLVNLPFVINSFDRLEAFRENEELFSTFQEAPLQQGVLAIDVTTYGTYGWASRTPVNTLEEARRVNFRIAEAPVNIDIYRAWNLRFTVMPWPDVPQALQTGVIDGLDHTPTTLNISRKFDIAKHYTHVDYAQGLYVHLTNKRWLDRLPEDIREIFLEVVAEESAIARQKGRQQQEDQIAAAKANGVTFVRLGEEDLQTLERMAKPVYEQWEPRIGSEYVQQVREYLKDK